MNNFWGSTDAAFYGFAQAWIIAVCVIFVLLFLASAAWLVKRVCR